MAEFRMFNVQSLFRPKRLAALQRFAADLRNRRLLNVAWLAMLLLLCLRGGLVFAPPPGGAGHQWQHPAAARAAAAAASRHATCHDGRVWPRAAFWQYVDGAAPGLVDVVHAEDRLYVVLVTKYLPTDWGSEPWLSGNWTMTFAVGGWRRRAVTVQAQRLGADVHGHTMTVHASLPEQLWAHAGGRPLRLTLQVQVDRGSDGTYVQRYDNVPFCVAPRQQQHEFRHLVACTQISHKVVRRVPEWVAYHHMQGFSHFDLYVDGDAALVRKALRPLVRAGLVTVIDYHAPPQYGDRYYLQQAQQNACLLHARGRARWVGLHDVDEFFQVMGNSSRLTVAQLLERHSEREHMAAFSVPRMMFGHGPQDTYMGVVQSHVLRALTHRAADLQDITNSKLIARPRGVNYISVHILTSGGTAYETDGEQELRVCHFKQPQPVVYEVNDTSMAAYGPAVQSWLRAHHMA